MDDAERLSSPSSSVNVNIDSEMRLNGIRRAISSSSTSSLSWWSSSSSSSSTSRYLGQPTHQTHPWLMNADHTTPGISLDEYSGRRERLIALLRDRSRSQKPLVAVLRAFSRTFSAPDVPNPFRQCSNFFYLTGLQEPDAVLMIHQPRPESSPLSTLFVAQRSEHQRLWEGDSAGIDGCLQLTGISDVRSHSELPKALQSTIVPGCSMAIDSAQFSTSPEMAELVMRSGQRMDLIEAVHQLRWRKSPAELVMMRKSAEIAGSAFCSTIRSSSTGRIWEGEIVGRLELEMRRRGARALAYPPVVAGGQRANTIHYLNADQMVEESEMVLVDAGCDLHGYCSDVTRCWPVSGRFTPAQAELYDALCHTQTELLEFAQQRRPLKLNELYHHMMAVMADALQQIGLFSTSLSKNELIHVVDQLCPHHVSHYLGLDVHDCGTVPRNVDLQPGVVITIEPEDNTIIAPRFRGLGMRIEDDVLIMEDSIEVLSDACPREREQLQSLMIKL